VGIWGKGIDGQQDVAWQGLMPVRHGKQRCTVARVAPKFAANKKAPLLWSEAFFMTALVPER